jgi:hypothetical protein
MEVFAGSMLERGMVGELGLRGLRVMVSVCEVVVEDGSTFGFGRWGWEAGSRGRTN